MVLPPSVYTRFLFPLFYHKNAYLLKILCSVLCDGCSSNSDCRLSHSSSNKNALPASCLSDELWSNFLRVQKEKNGHQNLVFSKAFRWIVHKGLLSESLSIVPVSDLQMVWGKKTWLCGGRRGLRAVRKEEAIRANLLTQLWIVSWQGITKGTYCLGAVPLVWNKLFLSPVYSSVLPARYSSCRQHTRLQAACDIHSWLLSLDYTSFQYNLHLKNL
jgi:hypothetical protein